MAFIVKVSIDMAQEKILYVPTTPAGTPLMYGMNGKKIASYSRDKAIANLLKDAGHMPYNGWADFEARGYTIDEYKEQK